VNVYMHEFNIALEKTSWLPISTGCLQAYALTQPKISANYQFMPFRFIKKPLFKMEPYKDPGIAAFSCSMWNTRMNLIVAERIKKEFPKCLVIFGGVDVPSGTEFLEKYPFIDITANGEGEQTFSDILLRHPETPDFGGIPSIAWRHGNEIIRNPGEPPFIKDLDCYPIPYTSGVFDYLLGGEYEYQVILETNRGCPFRCSFCFWGDGTMKMGKKYRFFGMDAVKAVADWCGKNDIRYIFCADSNYGSFERDKEIAEYFVETKRTYGAPDKFRVCYAKNAADRVFDVAKIFHGSNMEKALTLARQSNDETTLININRGNIKLSTFNTLAIRAAESNIPIYTELILCLPGETYETFVAGVNVMLEQSVNAQIFIYLCSVLTNTTMDTPEYREKHGIETRLIPLTEQHYKTHEADAIEELDEVVVATNTMDIESWAKSLMFSLFFQVFYSLRAGIFPLLYLQFTKGLKSTGFIEYIIEQKNHNAVCKEIFDIFKKVIDGILLGQSRDITFEGSPIYWPVEEAAFLIVSENKDNFYDEIYGLITNYLSVNNVTFDENQVREVIIYQKCRVFSQHQEGETIEFSYNIPEYFDSLKKYKPIELNKSAFLVRTPSIHFDSRHEFAVKILVYGRKSDGMLGDIRRSDDSEYIIS